MNQLKELYKKNKEIMNYLLVGGTATVISLGTYYLSVLTILDPSSAVQLQLANMLSWSAAVIFAYLANRIYVFESSNENKWKEAMSFILSRFFTLLVDMGIMFAMVTVLGLNDKIIKMLVQVIITILNYILSKYCVFSKVKN